MNIQEQLERAKKQLNACLEAELVVLENQHYIIGNRTYTRANLEEINKMTQYWTKRVEELEVQTVSVKRNRGYRAVPRDL